ncbi:hypothetical protein KI387_001587, partial [Taxus chinensis]
NVEPMIPITEEETHHAVCALGEDEAYGLDGFEAGIFQMFLHIVGKDVWEAVGEIRMQEQIC